MTSSNRIRGTASRLLVVAAMVASGLVGVSDPAAADSPIPEQWATACSATSLGLDKDTVSWSPVIDGDTTPTGGPVQRVATADGSWYPVVLVHGWVGGDTVATPSDRSGTFSRLIDLSAQDPFTADVSRSLIGQLQDIPGAAVFTFDYHPYSGRWVDDQHGGPALGTVIDCLSRASGQKVIIVAHSMGGLLARWAATHPGVDGIDRSSELSTVVTFGTPETGSVLAAALAAGGATAAASSQYVAVVRSILSACGRLSSNLLETGTVCDWLPGYVRNISGSAGTALRAGSPQLAALRSWPSTVAVDAIAGDTSFEVPERSGWFGLTWQTAKIGGFGDMIVTPQSALTGSTSSTTVSCDYQLNYFRAEVDGIGMAIGLVAASETARVKLSAFSGACFHGDLMREIHATNEALAAVADDIASRAPTATPTATVTLEPVDAAGTPAAGWHEDDSHFSPGTVVSCSDFVESSPSAVTSGVYDCGSTADSADACWPAGAQGGILCLRDPWSNTLVHYVSDPPLPGVEPPADPVPIGLELADGTRCRRRIGGAWSDQSGDHPGWVGTFACGHGAMSTWTEDLAVWTGDDLPRSGIDESSPTWMVYVGSSTGTLAHLGVARALFVGSGP